MIKKQEAGFHNGYKLWTVTAVNSKGAEVVFTNYSAAVMSVKVPDRDGNLGDVVLGYDNVEGFIEGTASQGAVVGRFANRIANGEFTLNGVQYKLFKNDGENTLHGGSVGYNKRVWELIASEYDENSGENHVVFGYTSPDGEENFPGTLAVTVDYCFDERNRLSITYEAESDKDTVLNLTNHSYFNLSSEGDVMDTRLKLYADNYTPVDEGLIPTGEIKSVKGTPFDFTELRSIRSKDIDGYDHNFVLNGKKEDIEGAEELPPIAAYAEDTRSGRTLTCYTDMPALQLYTANGLREIGKGGKEVAPQTAFCLETQYCPDSPNKPSFPSCVLKKGKVYHKVTVYEFGVMND
ncbi:MAG: galactose mutarotase [Firmicutes bacterium]|nr:galactose mutarotase [[Eubacterium] siraeum]MCM1487543.1 galactose mutarotase [Bacillota bacterium]